MGTVVREAAFDASESCSFILWNERRTAFQPTDSDPRAIDQDSLPLRTSPRPERPGSTQSGSEEATLNRVQTATGVAVAGPAYQPPAPALDSHIPALPYRPPSRPLATTLPTSSSPRSECLQLGVLPPSPQRTISPIWPNVVLICS